MPKRLDSKNCNTKKANIKIIKPIMAWEIICLAPAISSLFPPAFKYLNAPKRKYSITMAAVTENMGVTSLLVAPPKDVRSPKPKCWPMGMGVWAWTGM